MGWDCNDCGLPDPYHGDGDGVGSCDCPRCEYCGAAPGCCSCERDAEYYGEPYDIHDDGWYEAYEAYLST